MLASVFPAHKLGDCHTSRQMFPNSLVTAASDDLVQASIPGELDLDAPARPGLAVPVILVAPVALAARRLLGFLVNPKVQQVQQIRLVRFDSR